VYLKVCFYLIFKKYRLNYSGLNNTPMTKFERKKRGMLYSTSEIECSVTGPVARMGEKRNTYRLLVGKPEGKRPLRRPRRRQVDNIRMDLGEVGWGDVNWIGRLRIGTGGELL
jgi:hypothetical protein